MAQCVGLTPTGPSYTKSGKQQILGSPVRCGAGQPCDLSASVSITVGNTITNEKATTLTTSDGVSVSITAGVDMAEIYHLQVTTGYTHEWSKAVAESTGESASSSISRDMSFRVGTMPGGNWNLWFTPRLQCQLYTIICNGVEQSIEKCTPVTDVTGQPVGENGAMNVG